MRVLYFDCPSGISGNMTLGALLEVLGTAHGTEKGFPEEFLHKELAKLRLDGYRLDIFKKTSYGIAGTYVNVTVDGIDEYGHVHHICKKHEEDNHDHVHEHSREHRSYMDIYNIIENSDISEGAKDYAEAIFYTIAEAESKVHGVPIGEVHFHEVGAIDSIVDIVGTAILLDKLRPEKIVSSVVNEGCGFINCAHGKMSVPVPATAEIIKSKGVKFRQTEVPTELITPTGAGIIGTLSEEYGVISAMELLAIGYGLGSKDIGYANALRVMLGELNDEDEIGGKTEESSPIDQNEFLGTENQIIVIETNIDDSTGEEMGYALEKIMAIGARDAFFTPIYMKKNRPAYMLSVICEEKSKKEILEIIFRETTSIGARYYNVQREELERIQMNVETENGCILAKRVITPAGAIYVYPEYEDMKRIAEASGDSLKKIREAFESAVKR